MTDVNETILNPETPGAVNPVPVGAADAAEGPAANPAPRNPPPGRERPGPP